MIVLLTLLKIAVVVAVALGLGWLFRWLAVAVTRGGTRKALRTAPVTASFGMLVILIYVLVAVFAPLIAPYAEREVVGGQFLPWDAAHPLGTDNLGRDMFSRMIYGARNTVGIAFATTALAFFAGSFLGLLAATVGGWLEEPMLLLTEFAADTWDCKLLRE